MDIQAKIESLRAELAEAKQAADMAWQAHMEAEKNCERLVAEMRAAGSPLRKAWYQAHTRYEALKLTVASLERFGAE